MRRRLAIGSVAVFTAVALGSNSTIAADFAYLSQAVNTINAAFYTPTGLASDAARKDLMNLACVTLTRFLSDPAFEAVVIKAGEKDQAAEGEVHQAVSDVGKLNAFVAVETKALQANGYTSLSTTDIISTALSERRLVGYGFSHFRDAVSDLQTEACHLANQPAVTDRQVDAMRMGLLGVAIYAVDSVPALGVLGGFSRELGMGTVIDAIKGSQ
ncbi:hypothetical protein [Acidisoma sp. S159]|uniref:hypothetical protein n=1 Tax=Acidisoma sp. S159 TaxID=1747225 RepID=UPI001C206EE5|nr:hypothetical protein [Acidisoma sp. S159]